MVLYDSAKIYIESCTTLEAKIAGINLILDALESTALEAAGKGDVTEYSLDDGQTKIKTVYRSPMEVANAITAFETIKQRYVNKLNGRVVRMIDSKSFTRRRNGEV